MAGLAATYTPDLTGARRFGGLSDSDLADITFAIGELIVTQTRTRLADGKRGPDGEAWAPWSPAYAATRSGQHSLLTGGGDLRDSIANHSRGLEAVAGTNLVYGAIHQFGGDVSAGHPAIPARPWLGLSGENRREIEELVADSIGGLIR